VYSRGGDGGYSTSFNSTSRALGYGTGGQGAKYTSSANTFSYGQAGAPGIVVIRYPISSGLATATGNVSYNLVGNYHVFTFTGNGTILWS
jgi:hypothetical protein